MPIDNSFVLFSRGSNYPPGVAADAFDPNLRGATQTNSTGGNEVCMGKGGVDGCRGRYCFVYSFNSFSADESNKQSRLPIPTAATLLFRMWSVAA